jgi:hypothetical protein
MTSPRGAGWAIPCLTLATFAAAPTRTRADPPVAVAGGAVEIRLDGVLDEPAWQHAEPLGAFLQRDPKAGAPASEKTDVRVLFDTDNLYLGIACYDRTPSAIVATQLARDADLEVDDRVTVVIDPFFDHRNGFFFVVNPAGARADGQISNNAEELSYEWDGIWTRAPGSPRKGGSRRS